MFSKKPEAQSHAPQGGTNTMAGATFSVLGADLTVTGNLAATADLHIDGTVLGDITCAALVQGESGRIEGAIIADSARLAGTVKGSVSAGALVILKSARIEGDVSYDSLTIEQGAKVDGRFAPRGSELKLAIAGGTDVLELK